MHTAEIAAQVTAAAQELLQIGAVKAEIGRAHV